MKNFLLIVLLTASFTAGANPYSLSVPTDSRATYIVLEKGDYGNLKTIVTQRTGSSGITYSKRVYDCVNAQYKYLGTGDSISEMNTSTPDVNFSSIVEKSIAYYMGKEACR
ncbi:hypothetical protein [Enterobacter sp.]|uniref:hypothetical protein n=1 Tax=Enterobacter sp. TaxID=42895 RepID=UPI00296F891F|nr:hypothetical protein [Enterobacter sp.]